MFIHLGLLFFIPLGSEIPSRAMQANLSGVCEAEGNCFIAHVSEGEEPSTQDDYQIHRVDIRIYAGEMGFQKVQPLVTQYTPSW